jgi:hypothetical protein
VGFRESLTDAAVLGQPLILSNSPTAFAPDFAVHPWVFVDGDELGGALRALPRDAGPIVTVCGAAVRGPIALSWSTLNFVVRFERCLFTSPLWLNDATCKGVVLEDCAVAGVDARRLQCDTLRIRRSLIIGTLNLSAAALGRGEFGATAVIVEDKQCPNGVAVDANVISSLRSLTFNSGFLAVGRTRFIGAHIRGQLNLRDAYLLRDRFLDDLNWVRNDAPVNEALDVLRRHRLSSQRLIDRFALDGSPSNPTAFDDPPRDDGIGTLTCLSIHEATVERAVYLQKAICAGQVNLSAATIARLRAKDAVFARRGNLAVDANNLTVSRDFDLTGASLVGLFRMNGGIVGRDLDATDLDAFDDLSSDPLVQINRTAVTLDTKFVGASVRTNGGDARTVVSLAGSATAGSLVWRNVRLPNASRVDLSHTSLGRLDDDLESWPEGVSVELTGISCSRLSLDKPTTVEMRENWLSTRAATYSPDAYEQLGTIARSQGRESDARRLAIASERDRRRRGDLGFASRLWSLMLDVTVSYGYRASRALLILGLVTLISVPLYARAWDAGVIRHDDKQVGRCPLDAPCFTEFVFSLDTMIPVLDLNQTDNWHIEGTPNRRRWYEAFYLGQVAAGWLLTTAVVAGVARQLQRK